ERAVRASRPLRDRLLGVARRALGVQLRLRDDLLRVAIEELDIAVDERSRTRDHSSLVVRVSATDGRGPRLVGHGRVVMKAAKRAGLVACNVRELRLGRENDDGVRERLARVAGDRRAGLNGLEQLVAPQVL